MALLPLSEVRKIAHFDAQIRAKVALELVGSLPSPALEEDRLGYWFFYAAIFGPPPAQRFQLYPPSWRAWIDAETGAISRLEDPLPDEFGLAVPRGKPFAEHAWPSAWTWKDADRKREELLADLDRVVPLWEAEARAGTAAPGAGPADVRDRFLELAPPPYLPAYRTLGPSFFVWLGV